MKTLKTYAVWLLWTAVYGWRALWFEEPIRPRLDAYLLKKRRLEPPWRRDRPFKPAAVYFTHGDRWEVWFEDVQSYSDAETETMEVGVERAFDDGRIVGLKVYGESMKPKPKTPVVPASVPKEPEHGPVEDPGG